jgi:lipoprotein NlpI
MTRTATRTAPFLLLVGLATIAGAQTRELLDEATTALRDGKTQEALALVTKAIARDPRNVDAYRMRGSIYEGLDRYKDAVADFTKAVELNPKDAALWQERGVAHFKAGKIDESIRDYDCYIELRPSARISHWQRGISYYYAGRYDAGRRQFEGYQDFDNNDVENAVWSFMCVAKKDGIDKAKKGILKIGNDKRVPMRQVYDLFKGDLKPDDVFTASRAGSPSKETLSHRLFYAHLYVGIYYDLLGDRKQALAQLELAVEHRIPHYMWDVARIHRDILKAK